MVLEVQQNTPRKKRSVNFQTNIDYWATFKGLQPLCDSGVITSLDITRKGKIVFNLRDRNPSMFMVSSKGIVECYYYEDTPSAVSDAMARGEGYAPPEWTEIELIKKKLLEILIPKEGENLLLEITRTSVPRAYFEQQRHLRYDPPMSGIGIFGPAIFVCDYCGKEYTSKTWYDKHVKRHDPNEERMSIDTLMALSKLKRHRKRKSSS